MAYSKGKIRMPRQQAQSMDEVIREYVRSLKIASGFAYRRVFEAWYRASGAEAYTSNIFFRDGSLFCTMTSSVARTRLMFQHDALIEAMNRILDSDGLCPEDIRVKKLILR